MTLTGIKKHVRCPRGRRARDVTKKVGRVRDCRSARAGWRTRAGSRTTSGCSRPGSTASGNFSSAPKEHTMSKSDTGSPTKQRHHADRPRDPQSSEFSTRRASGSGGRYRPALVAQWWGRGNKLDVERMEVERGGHWRFVEHGPDGDSWIRGTLPRSDAAGASGADLRVGRHAGLPRINTRVFEISATAAPSSSATSLFYTTDERDGMLNSGMEGG